MADLVLLNSADLQNGLTADVADVIANFNQLITRSNLQDSQIAALVIVDADFETRISALEAWKVADDALDQETRIQSLEAASPSGYVHSSDLTYTVPAAGGANFIYHDPGAQTKPVTTLGNASGYVLNTVIYIMAGLEVDYLQLKVNQSLDSPTALYYRIAAGDMIIAVAKDDGSGAPANYRWRVTVVKRPMDNVTGLSKTADYTLEADDLNKYEVFRMDSATGDSDYVLPALSALRGDVRIRFRLHGDGSKNARVLAHADDGSTLMADVTGSTGYESYVIAADLAEDEWYVESSNP